MKKILVVDDSKTIRTLCEWIYKGLEDRLLTADSAQEARKIIQSESPDVVIVDYTLPDMDAYEFVASIKSQTHVIMMGGKFAPFSAEKALSSGAVATIIKPFQTAEFFATVDNAAAASLSAAAEAEPEQALSPAVSDAVKPIEKAVAPIAAAPKDAAEPIKKFSLPNASAVPPIGGFVSPSSAAKQGLPTLGAGLPGSKRLNQPSSSLQNADVSLARPSDFGASSPLHASEPAGIKPAPIASFTHASEASHLKVETAAQKANAATSESQEHKAVEPQAATQEKAEVQIDPAVLRAEVIAAVKSLLPAIVNSYLKKLIQQEVKPQLQNWVDSRVDALVKKMLDNK